MIPLRPVRFRRRVAQGGHQILEFLLVALLFIPMFAGMAYTSLNLIRSIQVKQVIRDTADMYIHGADFSDFAMQALVKRLASGLDLQLPASSGRGADNLGSAGHGIIWVSKIKWIGATDEAECAAIVTGVCDNANKFVFLERIRYGNGTLEAEQQSSLGAMTGLTRTAYGVVTNNKLQDPLVQLPHSEEMRQLWQVARTSDATTGRRPLAAGREIYVVEGYFKRTDLTTSAATVRRGVFARYFY